MQRALLCGCLCHCNHSIRGADDDELFGEEYALVYADGEGPDEEEEEEEEEEFGPEPY